MHGKVMVFVLEVLSGSDPGFWIPFLPVHRESTMTTATLSNANLDTMGNKDTMAGDFNLKSCRIHSNAHKSEISHPMEGNEEKLSASCPKREHQSIIQKKHNENDPFPKAATNRVGLLALGLTGI